MATNSNDDLTGGEHPAAEYDKKHGTYKPPVPRTEMGQEALLPAAAMPKAPQPTPFKVNGGK
jgi:hypothetical protein